MADWSGNGYDPVSAHLAERRALRMLEEKGVLTNRDRRDVSSRYNPDEDAYTVWVGNHKIEVRA